MDDDDDLAFDFESNLQQQQQQQQQQYQQSVPTSQNGAESNSYPPSASTSGPGSANNYKKNYRQTVCTYWLKGLCMKGDSCGFLHQFDAARMPTCRTLLRYGVCKEPDCPYKHTLDDIKECNMYKLGFCVYGPLCRFKHTRLPGPPPPIEEQEAAKPREFRNINLVVNNVNQGVQKHDEYGRTAGRGRGRYITHWRDRQQGALPGQAYVPPQLADRQPQQTLRLGMQQGDALQQLGPEYGPPPPRPPAGPPLGQQGSASPRRTDAAILTAAGQQSLPYGFL